MRDKNYTVGILLYDIRKYVYDMKRISKRLVWYIISPPERHKLHSKKTDL